MSDGQVRSATVQTSGGIYERPTVKLAVLDIGVGSNGHQDNQKPIPGESVSCATRRARTALHAHEALRLTTNPATPGPEQRTVQMKENGNVMIERG